MSGKNLDNALKRFSIEGGKYFPSFFQIIHNFEITNPTTMLKKLLSQLFEKLQNEKENDRKSKNGNTIYFVEEILEKRFGKPHLISARAIKGYFDKYVEEKENNAGEPSIELKNLMAQYLGYDSFFDFENKNGSENVIKLKEFSTKKSYKWLFLVALILVSSIVVYYKFFVNDELCIVWNVDHYDKVDCEGEMPNALFKDVNIEKFTKIVVNDTTTFFIKGQPIIWYGKSEDGTFEYFNSRGIHPKTMKELKPITEYVINKYVKKDSL